MNRLLCVLVLALSPGPPAPLAAEDLPPATRRPQLTRGEAVSRPLPRRGQAAPAAAENTAGQPGSSIWSSVVALLLIVAGIVVVSRLFKRHGSGASRRLPSEALEVLGRRPLDQRATIHLVRCGPRILMLGASADGVRTLAEFTDPVEVDLLAGLCRSTQDAPGGGFQALLKKTTTSRSAREETPRPSTSMSDRDRLLALAGGFTGERSHE